MIEEKLKYGEGKCKIQGASDRNEIWYEWYKEVLYRVYIGGIRVNVFHVDVVNPVSYDWMFSKKRVIKVWQRIMNMTSGIRLKW